MSYGTFSAKIKDHYQKVSYTLPGKTALANISIFKTAPATEKVGIAVTLNDNKKKITEISPAFSNKGVISSVAPAIRMVDQTKPQERLSTA